MFTRREEIDPETAALIEQRLERLLSQRPARRAAAEPSAEDGSRASARAGPELGPRREALPAVAEDSPRSRGARSMSAPEAAPGSLWRERLRAVLLSRAHLGVLAVLALLALLGAGWMVLRARPVALATPVPVATAATPAASRAPASPRTSPSPSAASLIVHVLGAVRRPGLVTLQERSRVQDAITAAGGLTRNADPGQLNLAQLVQDGQQVVIGTRTKPVGEIRDGGATSGTGSGTSPGGGGSAPSLDLNTATLAQLEELPGVGPVTAGKILAWREEHGRFSQVSELQEVDGIGPKTYAQLAPHCRV